MLTTTGLTLVVLLITAADRAAAFEPPETLAEMLAAQDTDIGALDDDARERWALRTVLRRGFAQSRRLDRVVSEAVFDPLSPWRNPNLMETLERRAAEARLRGPSAHVAAHATAVAFDIPLADHELVDLYIDYFAGRGRWYFAKWLARLDRYRPIMQPILEARGLPKDLVYLALIESGLVPHAVSRAGATGPWQFMAETGRRHDLRIDVWLDERRDFVRASEAAAEHLADLYGEFKDWHLAWAAYNAGSGRIRRAMARTGLKDYWQMVDERRALPLETRHYVPRIIAAAVIANDRQRYGFSEVERLDSVAYDEIDLNAPLELRLVARRLAIPLDRLRELNPALLQDVTPPHRNYTLRVPHGRGADTSAWIASLPAERRLTYRHHTIRAGDTLFGIAKRYDTTVAAIREFNAVHNPKALRPGRTLIIPSVRKAVRSQERPPAIKSTPTAASSPATDSAMASHVVASGETLWSIARRYGVSVAEIKGWNRRRGNVVVVGETLAILGAGATRLQ
ncbi:MAG: LysM peptidoglycan-binding domain-containing protein [Deltaproteobacteria bacterium]|nr:LysM peptidoglycan-binding domain-containing protein [Deltaproteobacteria bacterium]